MPMAEGGGERTSGFGEDWVNEIHEGGTDACAEIENTVYHFGIRVDFYFPPGLCLPPFCSGFTLPWRKVESLSFRLRFPPTPPPSLHPHPLPRNTFGESFHDVVNSLRISTGFRLTDFITIKKISQFPSHSLTVNLVAFLQSDSCRGNDTEMLAMICR